MKPSWIRTETHERGTQQKETDRQTNTNWDTVGARTRSDGAGAVVKDWTRGKCDDRLVQRLTLFLLTADKSCSEQGMKGGWKLRF